MQVLCSHMVLKYIAQAAQATTANPQTTDNRPAEVGL